MRSYAPIAFILAALGAFGTGVFAIVFAPDSLSGYGLVLAAAPFLILFGRIGARTLARTARTLPATLAATIAGAGLAGAGAFTGEGALPALLAALMVALVLLYIYWYSVFPGRHQAGLEAGGVFPVVSFERIDGEAVSTADFEGSPVIYMFYRGNWCPLCQVQVREIAGLYREIEERGAKVVLVSPQPHDKTRELAEKFDVSFEFLVDAGGAAARKLGVAHVGGVPKGVPGYDADTVYPTVIVVDAERRILFSDQTDNYRVRPEPQMFLDVLTAKAA